MHVKFTIGTAAGVPSFRVDWPDGKTHLTDSYSEMGALALRCFAEYSTPERAVRAIELLNKIREQVGDEFIAFSKGTLTNLMNFVRDWYKEGCPGGRLPETELLFEGTHGLVDFSVYDTGRIRIGCQKRNMLAALPDSEDTGELHQATLSSVGEVAAKQVTQAVNAVVGGHIMDAKE